MSWVRFRLGAAVVAATLSAGQASAELGGPTGNVAADGAKMGARLTSTSMGSYVRHDLTRANGGMVHEFSNIRGQVFAVTWSGPGKPDLRALLGRHFAALQGSGEAMAGAMHSLRRPPQVSEADLQIETGGHMGWFQGVAFIPSLAPTGFVAADLPPAL